MKTTLLAIVTTAIVVLSAASPVVAHHFFPRESDEIITLEGKLTSFEWVNPHSRFFIDVSDTSGNVTSWEIELGSPAALTRRGWTTESLKFGDTVKVDVVLWKGRENAAVAQDVTLPDGNRLFAGSHAGDPQ